MSPVSISAHINVSLKCKRNWKRTFRSARGTAEAATPESCHIWWLMSHHESHHTWVIYICVCIYMHIHIYICIHTHTHSHTHIHTHVCTHTHWHVHTHTQIHTHIHTDRRQAHRAGARENEGLALQRTAAHCNILQHTATHYQTLQQCTAAHCNTPQHTGMAPERMRACTADLCALRGRITTPRICHDSFMCVKELTVYMWRDAQLYMKRHCRCVRVARQDQHA